MATGLAWSFASLLICRFLFGAGEAGAFPNTSRSFSQWFPVKERGRAHGIIFMGTRLGGALAPPLAVALIEAAGWRVSFWADIDFGAESSRPTYSLSTLLSRRSTARGKTRYRRARYGFSRTGLPPVGFFRKVSSAHMESHSSKLCLARYFDYPQLPFNTVVLGAEVTVERLDLTDDDHIVVLCRRGQERQRLPILDLPLPEPPPKGWKWIEAYRHWAR